MYVVPSLPAFVDECVDLVTPSEVYARHLPLVMLTVTATLVHAEAAKKGASRPPPRAWPRADQRPKPTGPDLRRTSGIPPADRPRSAAPRTATGPIPTPDAARHRRAAADKIKRPSRAPKQAETAADPAARSAAGDAIDSQPGTASVQPAAGDQCHGEALPPAPPPVAAKEVKPPAPDSSGSDEQLPPENPAPADSAPSSPRIAACVAAAAGQSCHATASGDLSPSQASHDARNKERLTPAARAPQDMPSAQYPPSAVDAESDSNTPPGAVSETDAAAAAATMAAAKASPHSESPATSGPWGAQLAALLPAERHKPGSKVLTSAQAQGWPHRPLPSPPHVSMQPGLAGDLAPTASAAQQPQPGMPVPLAAGLSAGSEMAAGVCQPHSEDSSHGMPSAVEDQSAEDVKHEGEVEGLPITRRNSYGLEGASLCKG